MIKHLPKQHADNAAVLMGAIIEVMVILGITDRLELTAKDIAALGGLGLIIAGALRSMLRAMRASKSKSG